MNRIFINSRSVLSFACVLLLSISACKKDKPAENTSAARGGTNGSRRELSLDSLFLYAKQIYYWNDAIPAYEVFNPRQYSSKSTDLLNYEDELYALSQLKKDPATNIPYEYYGDGFPKYSFIDDRTLANPNVTASLKDKANVDTEGNGNDIGIRPVFYLRTSSESGAYYLFVTAVYPGSPADAAGVKRGWVITKVNGSAIGTSYTADNQRIIDAFDAASVTIEGINAADNVAFTKTLSKASYKSSPVYTSKVITRSGKKIGYLAFARFSTLTNQDAPSDTNLDPVFADFSAQNVTDLVIDLRYNGGGYINTAEYLADLIAPSGLTGKAMFKEFYNANMQAAAPEILKNQPSLTSAGKVQYKRGNSGEIYTYADIDYSVAANTTLFAKKGGLNTVNNVVFIVSRNTASASELLINALKPYMTVSLVGETTYGKPVGFFPFRLENRYDVYMPLFETKNASDQGGYYSGMVPGTLSSDPSIYPFGDEREANLLAALNLIAPAVTGLGTSGSIADRSNSSRAAAYSSVSSRPVNPNSEFNGMIQLKHKLKK